MRNLHRKNFEPTEQSRICSLHFADDDFEQSPNDTNRSRSRLRRESSKRRLLKPDAVPRFFLGMPAAYLLQDTYRSGNSVATSGFRAVQTMRRHEEAEAELWDSERVGSCAEIEERLRNECAVPGGFCIVKNDTSLALCFVEFGAANFPWGKGVNHDQWDDGICCNCIGKASASRSLFSCNCVNENPENV